MLSVWVLALGTGCASLLMPSGPSDREIQAMIDRNHRNLVRLQADMFEEYVFNIMGPPQRLEGYSWGTVWLYRTAVTKGARTTLETDFTPLVFDRSGVLLGWGSDFLATHRHRHSSISKERQPCWREHERCARHMNLGGLGLRAREHRLGTQPGAYARRAEGRASGMIGAA
jgi:hypothetical protein